MSTPDEPAPKPSTQPDIAFSPRQILGGFVLLAAFVAMLLRLRRAKRPSND